MPPDNERARLRSIMYEPSKVWLVSAGKDRWLFDQFVLYRVTDAEVIGDLQDGPYQLMATGDWRMEARDSVPPPDVSAYLERVSVYDWKAAEPTEWSVAEHPGKAMLWTAEGAPALLGESTWAAIKRHHSPVQVEWAPNGGAGTFRFLPVLEYDDADGTPFSYSGDVFAYAAGIRIPEGQEDIAKRITYDVAASAVFGGGDLVLADYAA